MTRILRAHHDNPLAGHFGVARTLELLTRNYYWPKIRYYVKRYVVSCDTCARSKAPRHRPHGELQNLPVPARKWSQLTMDFVTDLPPSGHEAHDTILVVVDRYTKMAHYIPVRKGITAAQLAKVFLQNIVRLHGIPDGIVTDRGSIFTSRFWSTLCARLQIQRKLGTAFHPQTDGQTERQNQTMEQYLRAYMSSTLRR
jgi:transposase InsO family protein